MKIRYKKDLEEGYANQFNMASLSEVLTGDDSSFQKDLDVYLEATKEWKDMREAFREHDIIVDNYNTRFFEPKTVEDRIRGYTE